MRATDTGPALSEESEHLAFGVGAVVGVGRRAVVSERLELRGAGMIQIEISLGAAIKKSDARRAFLVVTFSMALATFGFSVIPAVILLRSILRSFLLFAFTTVMSKFAFYAIIGLLAFFAIF